MATNFERLQKCSSKQLEAFISSIVSKRASEFVDWGAWLSSSDPDVTFTGEDAVYKNEDGTEKECRYLSESKDDDGIVYRRIFFFEEDGDVSVATVKAHLVRKLSEPEYPEEVVIDPPTATFFHLFKDEEPAAEETTEIDLTAAAPAVTETVVEEKIEETVPEGIDLDDLGLDMSDIITDEINTAADQAEQAEDEITGMIQHRELEAAAEAEQDKPFTDLQNIKLDDVIEDTVDDELPEIVEETVAEVTIEEIPAEEPEPEPEEPKEPDSTDFLDYKPQLDEYDSVLESIENTMQMDLKDVPLDEEDEPIGELLQTLKERSALYDPNDQEDHELPTIAFTAIAEDKLVNNE